MRLSYSDLHLYRTCPRLFSFVKAGYQSPMVNIPMTIGTLVDVALTQHFNNMLRHTSLKPLQAAYAEVKKQKQVLEKALADSDNLYEELSSVNEASKKATSLVTRYLASWAKDLKPVVVKPVLQLGNVICHPDMIATFEDRLSMVDFKTGGNPDVRWYDISHQCDLYAYVACNPPTYPRLGEPKWVVYEAISEKGIYRHVRPTRLASGERLYHQISQLARDVTRYDLLGDICYEAYTEFDCPSTCAFFIPCWLLETEPNDLACKDYLNQNYIKTTGGKP